MTPEEMEQLPKKLERLFTQMELDVMFDIVERIKDASEVRPVADWLILSMVQMGKSKQWIKNQIAGVLELSQEEINAIYKKAAESPSVRNPDIYTGAGIDATTLSNNEPMQQLLEGIQQQTMGEMENITRTTGFLTKGKNGKLEYNAASDYLKKQLDQAIAEITTGTYDYNTSIQRVINEMTTSGLRTVDYASGKTDRVEVAARRAVMTGVAQMTAKIVEKNMEELGTEYVEVDWHMGSRPSHMVWQGKVFKWNK